MSKIFQPHKLSFGELTRMLREYEQKHGVSTIEFFRKYEAGELGDDDDMMMWAGIYHPYLTSHPVRKFMQNEAIAV